MRVFLAVCCLLVVQATVVYAQPELTNQNLFDLEPFRPEHYTQRVAQFEEEPVTTGRIIFLGNSITEGGNWPQLLGDSTVVNRGIGGDITFGVLERLDDIARRRPSKLFILIGINDIGKDIPDAVIADNVRKIIEHIRTESPATTIYLQSLLPVNPAYLGFPQHYDKEDHVLRVNKMLRTVAQVTQSRFVNLFPLFMDAQERLDEQYTGDGLHLNAKGYAVWVDHLRHMGYL